MVEPGIILRRPPGIKACGDNLRPLGREHPLDATPYFFVGEVLAALQLGFADLHGFEKVGLFFQILADRFLRQRIRISSSVAGQLRQFVRLLGVEMYCHGLKLGVARAVVKLSYSRLRASLALDDVLETPFSCWVAKTLREGG